jgi:hypothetical protein
MGSIVYYRPDGMGGREPNDLRTWLFSAPAKQRLLDGLLVEHPNREWSRTELARLSGQHTKARMDKYVEPLLSLGLLRKDGRSYSVNERHPMVPPLTEILVHLRAVPTTPFTGRPRRRRS